MIKSKRQWEAPSVRAFGNVARITQGTPGVSYPKCPGSGDTEFAQQVTVEHPPVGSACS